MMQQRREAAVGGEVARVVFAVLLWLFALTQGPIVRAFFPLDVTPNLVLVAVTLWAGYYGLREGIAWAFVAGLFLDLLLFAPLGAHALAMIAVALAIEPMRRWVFGDRHAWALLAVFFAALLHDAVYLIVTRAAGHGGELTTLWRLSIARGLTDALAAVALLPLILWLRRWGGHNGDLPTR